jgi:hypothetical protein
MLKAASLLLRKRRRRVGQGIPAGLSIPKTESAAPHAEEVPKLAAPRERLVQLRIGFERLDDLRNRSSETGNDVESMDVRP